MSLFYFLNVQNRNSELTSPTFWERCEIEESQRRGIQSKEAPARKFVLRVVKFPSGLKNRGQLRAVAAFWLFREFSVSPSLPNHLV